MRSNGITWTFIGHNRGEMGAAEDAAGSPDHDEFRQGKATWPAEDRAVGARGRSSQIRTNPNFFNESMKIGLRVQGEVCGMSGR
jgi:hypothetical protein